MIKNKLKIIALIILIFVSIIACLYVVRHINKASLENIPDPHAISGILVPKQVVNDFLKSYEKEDLEKIQRDFQTLFPIIFPKTIKAERNYIATAGGPGASKSTVLETFIRGRNDLAYIDPDQRTLKFMLYTYLQDTTNYAVSQAPSFQIMLETAYNKWRGASNYIANSFLNYAIENGYSVAHGTTSSAKIMGRFYETIKQQGYTITLLLCVSSDDNRWAAIDNRAKTQAFVQSTESDVREKGTMFFDNFPIYFQYADMIHVYWVEKFNEGFTEVATYSPQNGLNVLDPAFKKVQKIYHNYAQNHPKNPDEIQKVVEILQI